MKNRISVKDYLDLIPIIGERIESEWVGEDKDGNPVDINEITCNSTKLVKWRCSNCGQVYIKPVYRKVMRGDVCRNCMQDYTSFVSMYLFAGLKQLWPNTLLKYLAYSDAKNRRGFPFNIYVPELGLFIDYITSMSEDKVRLLDRKREAVKEHGDSYLQVFNLEYKDPIYSKNIIAEQFYEYDQLKKIEACERVLDYIVKNHDADMSQIDKVQTLKNIEDMRFGRVDGRSIAVKYSELLSEWDYEKNNGLDPNKIKTSSILKVWWKCPKCGHSWQASPVARINGRSRCSECGWSCFDKRFYTPRNSASGLSVNSLANRYPELAKEWDTEKNGITPDKVKISENKRRHWKCRVCGAEFQTRVYARIHSQTGCRKCKFNWARDNFEEYKKKYDDAHPKKIIFDNIPDDDFIKFDSINE